MLYDPITLEPKYSYKSITIFSIYYTVPNIHWHYTLNTIYIQTSMNWRVYTSHHTRHFSKRQCLPGDCFSPLIEDHPPKYIDFNSCDSALCRIWTERRGGTAQPNSYIYKIYSLCIMSSARIYMRLN